MKAVNMKLDSGCCTAVLGNKGRVWTPFVRMESCSSGPFIKRYKMANGDVERYTETLMMRKVVGGKYKADQPYPIKKIVNHMLRIGRMHGIQKAAKKILMEAKCEIDTGKPCTHRSTK